MSASVSHAHRELTRTLRDLIPKLIASAENREMRQADLIEAVRDSGAISITSSRARVHDRITERLNGLVIDGLVIRTRRANGLSPILSLPPQS